MDVANVLAEPVEFTLGDGQKYRFAMFNFGMLADFEREHKTKHKAAVEAEQKRRVAEIAEHCKDVAPFDRGRLMLQVMAEPEPFDALAAMFSVDGMLDLLTMSVKVHNPDMMRAELGRLLPFGRHGAAEQMMNELTPFGTESVDDTRRDLLDQALDVIKSTRCNTEAGKAAGAEQLDQATALILEALGRKEEKPANPPASAP